MPLAKAYEIYSEATMATSGTVKTVRGPSMSATPGKVQVVGITSIKGEKVRTVSVGFEDITGVRVQTNTERELCQPFSLYLFSMTC